MARRRSIAAAAAIFAATVSCDGRAVHVDESSRRNESSSRHAKRGAKERELNIRLHQRESHIRREEIKINSNRRRRQTDASSSNSGIDQFEPMTQFEPVYQASHYVQVVSTESKSGKSLGKSHKEGHHLMRPPQHVQQPPPPQYPASNEASWSDIMTTSDGNQDYDDVTFTWSQDDAAQDIQADSVQLEHQQIAIEQANTTTTEQTTDFNTSPLSPQDLILIQYENMDETTDDDDDAFQWAEDDNWINDGHDDNFINMPLNGKASKLFKHGVHHSGKSGKGSKTGDGGHIWGGSGRPTFQPNPIDSMRPIGTSSPTKASGQLPTTSPPVSSKVPTPQGLPTNQPISSIVPPTPSPFKAVLPPLTWAGVDNCSFLYPCDICTGDCDQDSDCQADLRCFKRGEGESTQVPGCASGGPGDIAGADYCYDPSGTSAKPTRRPIDASRIPSAIGSSSPTMRGSRMPVQSLPPNSLTPSSTGGGDLPSLEFVGVTGCSITSPCDTCQGDCASDLECQGSLKCFKRADGMKNQVPGCAVGGKGDIAGADYCHDENTGVSSPMPTKSPVSGETLPPLIAFPTVSPDAGTSTIGPIVTAPSLKPSSMMPVSSVPSITKLPSSSSAPSIFVMPPESEMPSSTAATEKYLIRSRSRTSAEDWCASGALSPDYYQLMLAPCIADTNDPKASTPMRRIEQMDQLWTMDGIGLIHSVYDYQRCMAVQSDPSVLDEAGVEIVPCDSNSTLQKFVYKESKATLTLQGDRYSPYCVTYLGDTASKGSPLILERCESEDKFGWDFIPEEMYGQPSPSPTVTFPVLKYNGRDACKPGSPCDSCTGDCDKDSDCKSGLLCFQRAKDDTSQVPGCEVGGTQDIPGADYCYDPESPLPPLIWLGEGNKGCSKTQPCNRCTGSCTKDTDCVANLKCFMRNEGEDTLIPGCSGGGAGDHPGGDYCYDPNAEPHPTIQPSGSGVPSPLISLRWRGSDGCTPDSPCPICTGDCDDDEDCESSLECFKRYAGDRGQVPGCDVGGLGDIPGGDYCYDPKAAPEKKPTESPGEMPAYPPSEQVLGPNDS
ncbi:hypothetical protein ACHAXN_010414 [Cyclotella atomus]